MVMVLTGLLLGGAGLLLQGPYAVAGAVAAVTAVVAGYYRELHHLAVTIDPPAHKHDRRYSTDAR